MFSFKRKEVNISDIKSDGSLKHIWVLLDRIASTSSRLEKENIIRQNLDTEDFKRVVMYALDPFKVYHLTSIISSKGLVTAASVMNFKYKEPGVDNIFHKLDDLYDSTGASLSDRTELSWLASADDETRKVVNCILAKDLKCGASVKTFRKFFPEIPNHEVALCDKDLEKFIEYCHNDPSNVVYSDKLDGVRTWAFIDGDKVKYVSRNGKEYLNFVVFDEEVRSLINSISDIFGVAVTSVIIDGEAIADNRDFESFVGNARKQDNADTSQFTYNVFDVALKDDAVSSTPLKDRLAALEKCIGSGYTRIRRVKHTALGKWSDIQSLLEDALLRGEEGLVLKNIYDPYTYGRSTTWCKVKKRDTVDLPVISVQEGTGAFAGMMGALICNYEGTMVKVGSGFDMAQRVEYMKNPPKMIEVYFQNKTAKGSLRFPIFVRDRFDKVVEEDNLME